MAAESSRHVDLGGGRPPGTVLNRPVGLPPASPGQIWEPDGSTVDYPRPPSHNGWLFEGGSSAAAQAARLTPNASVPAMPALPGSRYVSVDLTEEGKAEMSPATAASRHAAHAGSGGGQRWAEPAAQRSTRMPPEPGQCRLGPQCDSFGPECEPEVLPAPSRLLRGTTPAAASAPTRQLSWLLDDVEFGPEEPLEVRRCREQLRRRLGGAPDALTVSRLYRALRDTLDGPGIKPGGFRRRTPHASVRAACSRLTGLTRRRLRGAFRTLEDFSAASANDDCQPQQLGKPGVSPLPIRQPAEALPDELLHDMLRSQAHHAVVLERRLLCIPEMYRLAWLISCAEHRCIGGALTQWRSRTDAMASADALRSSSGQLPGASGAMGVTRRTSAGAGGGSELARRQMIPEAHQPGPGLGVLRRSSAGRGDGRAAAPWASPRPVEGWGEAQRTPGAAVGYPSPSPRIGGAALPRQSNNAERRAPRGSFPGLELDVDLG